MSCKSGGGFSGGRLTPPAIAPAPMSPHGLFALWPSHPSTWFFSFLSSSGIRYLEASSWIASGTSGGIPSCFEAVIEVKATGYNLNSSRSMFGHEKLIDPNPIV